ncbi:hypothetical protein [Metabacillus sp. B2-18]|uniref:hypothetical protein n=1 Tax=Metabacillus sp. B2-18 TaxID=2897333 RepID=UPI001E42F39B|nr:hypothetical protein [Metabacillus sp. B2-18]UGB30009.1 hypothetical protein LPC09_20190 [Metabacillus sp. B2-18]
MGKKTDLRVIRTKKLIKEALLKLIQEKGFENMTILTSRMKHLLIEQHFIYTTKTNTICLSR